MSRVFALLGAVACASGARDSETAADDTAGSAFTDETQVLIIGAGPAGVAAALSAREQGVEVQVLDRAASAGDGIAYATRLFAVGTPEQADRGIEDSPTLAAEDWEELTGVPGDTPSVQAFLEGSAPTIAWLESYGLEILGVGDDPDAGETSRLHQVEGSAARTTLTSTLGDALKLQVTVDSLIMDEGRVIGARWTDLNTGETGATRADAVVVATGGFLRDRARVDAARPDLANRRLLFETNLHADGSGLDFLDEVGAGHGLLEDVGVYVHAIQDPDNAEGEALVLGQLDAFLIVDETGARFADEGRSRSFDFFDMLPDGEVYAIVPESSAISLTASRPPYNTVDPDTWEYYLLPELETLSDDVFVAESPNALAELAGIDRVGLSATIDEVNYLVATDGIDAFGRDFTDAPSYGEELLWAVRLTPGLAKAFGGAATDTDAHLLDGDGAIIPGIYVAGEVAGMIPGGGAGLGFSGSVNACYFGGRVAGTNAAAEAR